MQTHHHDLRNSPLDQLTPLPSIRFLNQQNVPIQRNRNLSSISADQKAEITRKKFDALESNLTRTLITVANLKKTLLHNQNSNNPTPVKPLYAYACREEETDDDDDDNNNISSSSWFNYYQDNSTIFGRRNRRGRFNDRNEAIQRNEKEKKRRKKFERQLKESLVLEYEMKNTMNETCTICLESIEIKSRCKKISRCGHIFHARCIDQWFKRSKTCPNCRREPFMGMF